MCEGVMCEWQSVVSHDSVCGVEVVPGASHVTRTVEQQSSPGHCHCCVQHTPHHPSMLGGREGSEVDVYLQIQAL